MSRYCIPAQFLLAVLGMLPTLAGAQTAGPVTPDDLLRRGEKQYQAGDLQEAEKLYRRALEGGDAAQRRRCYDQLLVIYARLGRHDRAVQIGAAYEQQLRSTGDRDRLRDLRLEMGECLFALGHWRASKEKLEQVVADAGTRAPLSPGRRLTALIHLARAATNCGDRDRGMRFWRQVEEEALARLRDSRQPLKPAERVECVWRLDDSCRFLGKHDLGIEWLQPLLRLHDEQTDSAGKCETLRRLANHHAGRGDDAAAEQCLRQALALLGKRGTSTPLLQGDLSSALAGVLRRRQPAEADKLKEEALAHYETVLKKGRGGHEMAGALAAFWKLQAHYQSDSQYLKALQLAMGQADQWGLLLQPKLKSEQGTLQVILGAYKEAQGLLRDAVEQLERQDPPNLVELPRALNNLAIVEQVTDDPARAEERGRQCLELYRRYQMTPDLIQVETYNLLGTCAALRGEYALGVERFRAGVALCVKLGAPADPLHSNLLLNIALLHKAQGDLAEALRACEAAGTIFDRYAEPEALGRAAFAAARASICAARGQVREARELAQPILAICRKHQVQGGPLLITALHCQALYHLSRREFAPAEETWHRVLKIQEQEKQSLLIPRTLNYLALTAELQGRYEEAEKRYRRAHDLQRINQRALPATQFITCWRLAGVVERLGRRPEARRLLNQAIEVVEAARLKTYGESQQRATYFAQFAPAFDQLVRWSVRDGDLEGAFAAIARGRSRTLLDQLQTAHVDPRELLRGPEGEALRSQEAELRLRIAGLRARAQLLPLEELETKEAKNLLAEFDRAQKAYAGVWREITNASPIYRSMAAEDPSTKALAVLRNLRPKTALLVYHLGREDGYLFLGRGGKLEAFPLSVPAVVAHGAAAVPPTPIAVALAGARGMALRPRPPQPPAPLRAASGPTVPLTLEVAQAITEPYRRQVADPQFRPSRGFHFHPRQPDRPVPVQRVELLADVLLPAEVRRRLREADLDTLLVVPDGPLHKLPLEALVIEEGRQPRYLLDVLPPIVYAPSLSILALLTERQALRPGPLSLLTVCNPAYPEGQGTPGGQRAVESFAGLLGQLPPLPFTATESRHIRGYFDPDRVVSLEGANATKTATIAAVRGRRVVHLAAHGFADERFGNLFGALALTPPPPDKAHGHDDGFLSLHEIYTLPLEECELAVLSACVTNVGPQRPLEAGVTLASGFLTAGARRVVASHWSVDDQSTAELMGAFFKEVTAAARKGDRVSYARALQQARRQIRDQPEWASPFYWAPFVLLGPED